MTPGEKRSSRTASRGAALVTAVYSRSAFTVSVRTGLPSTSACTVPYPPSTTHLSAVAHRNPGWVAVSVVGEPAGAGVLDGELLLANVDTGDVCRVGHHRSFGGEGRWGYWAEPHVVVSPTATRLLFGSDWGNGRTVEDANRLVGIADHREQPLLIAVARAVGMALGKVAG